MTQRILRRREVESIVGVSRATIYHWMSEKRFPEPVKLGTRSVGWTSEAIEAWLASREPRRSTGWAAPAAPKDDGEAA